jgi:serine/threonine protein kinase
LLVNDHVKVADFGLVRLQEGLLSREATFCGTPHYMAPEVWDRHTGPASDQYSLAVTYVELRTGQRPFPGRTLDEVEKLHREATPDMPTMYPAERAVLERALAKEPDDRYRNCQEFVTALVESVAPHLKRGSAADILLRDTDGPERATRDTADDGPPAARVRRSSGSLPRAEPSRSTRPPAESARPPRTHSESAIPSSIGVPPSVEPDHTRPLDEEPTSSRGLRVLLILIVLGAILVAVRWFLWPRLRVWLGMDGTNPRTLLLDDARFCLASPPHPRYTLHAKKISPPGHEGHREPEFAPAETRDNGSGWRAPPAPWFSS